MKRQASYFLGLLSAFVCLIGCSDGFLRLEPRQEKVFVKHHGGGYNQLGAEVLTTDRGFLLAGTSFSGSLGEAGQIYLVETDAGGNEIGTSLLSVGSPGIGGSAHAMIRTQDNGYLICGTALMQDGHTDVWVIKLDAEYRVSWNHVYGDTAFNESAMAIAEAANGQIYVLGSTDGVDLLKAQSSGMVQDSTDLYLLKIHPDMPSEFAWAKTYGYTGMDRGD